MADESCSGFDAALADVKCTRAGTAAMRKGAAARDHDVVAPDGEVLGGAGKQGEQVVVYERERGAARRV